MGYNLGSLILVHLPYLRQSHAFESLYSKCIRQHQCKSTQRRSVSSLMATLAVAFIILLLQLHSKKKGGMTHPLVRIEIALQEGNIPLANDLLKETDENPARIYYQVIRDGLVATFRHLVSSAEWSEWDSFCYCSNALLELTVKNVPISKCMEVLVMHKLSSYGLRRLCGSPVEAEKKIDDWRDSIGEVVRWVEELRHRTKCYDFIDVDDQVAYRIRIIHNHLFVVRNRCELRGLTLKEMIFCLAIFARVHHQDPEYIMYRMVINKRNVMQFLLGIASRLKGIINPDKNAKLRKSSVLKKLGKTYRRLKQMHSINKIMRYVRVHREFGVDDFKRDNASLSLAAFKRFNQVCGEAIKNTTETPNLTAKSSKFISKMLTEAITLNSKFRNFSCHGFPLSQLYHRESDDVIFYKGLISYIKLTAEMFYCISFFNLIDCYRYLFGLIRRCRTIEDLCALIRYLGSSTVRLIHESEIENDSNFDKAFEELLDTYGNLLEEIEMMAFANAPIAAIHHHLYTKLTNKSVFDILMEDQKRPSPQNSSIHQYYIQQQMELNRDSNEQWSYRERTRQILRHITSDSALGASTFAALENKLHSALSKARKGYYQNIFSLDAKTQAIKNTLGTYLVGQKTSSDFRKRNLDLKSKLSTLRHHDENELNLVFQKIILNIRDAYKQSDCDTIDKLIMHIDTIPLKYRLAIEYWQLQVMEILSSSGHFGDSFQVLTKSVPMIWGRSYRNYLAHDSLSYDLLTSSGYRKVLINGFVLAFESSELNIFSRSPNFKLHGLATLEKQGFQYLEVQSQLIQCIRNCDVNQLVSCLQRGAELNGKFLLPLGKILRPILYDLRMIISQDQLDRNQVAAFIHELSNHFYSDINLAVKLNLLQIDNLPIQEAIQQFEHLQPALIAPCIGVILPHLVGTGNIQLLQTLVDRYVGSKGKSIHRMTTSCMFLDPTYISNFPLQGQFSIVIIQNNIDLFNDLVDRCCKSEHSEDHGSEILKPIMEHCCHHGRLKMIRKILDSGLKCDQSTMSNCLKGAIDQRHWNIVDLLLTNSRKWFDEEVLLQVVSKRNFRMTRRLLAEPLPEASVGKIVEAIVQSGPKRLLKYLIQIGLDIWTCSNILSLALKNENSDVLNYLEDSMSKSDESITHYDGLTFWIDKFRDLKTLMRLYLDPEFILNMLAKPLVAKRWTTKLTNLLKTDEAYFAETFHFIDNDDSFSLKLTEMHLTNTSQIIRTCKIFSNLIYRLPRHLFVIKDLISVEIRFLDSSIRAQVDLTLYSTTENFIHIGDLSTITCDSSQSIAESIHTTLRSYLLRIPHPKLGTVTITTENDSKLQRFFYIQIDSNSCTIQQSLRSQFSIPQLFNKHGTRNILHNLQPDTSSMILSSLLRLGADPAHLNDRSETPFHTTLARPFPLSPIKIMYRHHLKSSDPLETNIFNRCDRAGYSPLQAAVVTHIYDVVEFMLQNGADPMLANRRGEAAVLAHAILGRNVRMVELLLCHCPSLVSRHVDTEERSTALEVAVRINHDHIVRILLENGAELNYRNGRNCTALMLALQCEAVESLQIMLGFAVRMKIFIDNDVDGCGTTALEYARRNILCQEIFRAIVCYHIKQEFLNLINLSNKME